MEVDTMLRVTHKMFITSPAQMHGYNIKFMKILGYFL
jgi:hypothetical protein